MWGGSGGCHLYRASERDGRDGTDALCVIQGPLLGVLTSVGYRWVLQGYPPPARPSALLCSAVSCFGSPRFVFFGLATTPPAKRPGKRGPQMAQRHRPK
ncbi:hypothetical protein E2C01_080457 [Portunus trituberculatus]|uniref:Uncharacterized protein n=1 Tax=Portunus trituberculatus TaxID=210409 RepID=A0A5B7IZN9_PORTR|nr:hypothetical protein [Portunus trituberculatus]